MQQPDNERIVDAALEQLGWPYRHAGRNEYGIDCLGVIIVAAHKCGFSDYDIVNYPKRPVARDLIKGMKNHLVRIPNEDMRSGDIPMFGFYGYPCHLGIANFRGKKPTIIHAYAPARKVVEQTIDSLLMNNIAEHVMTFRYIGK